MATNRLVFTSPEVEAAVLELDGYRLPTATLASWAARGFVVPSVSWTKRRGKANVRLYSLQDVARCRLLVQLRQAGLGMSKCRTVLAYVERELPDVLKPGTKAKLVVVGFTARIATGRQTVEPLTGQLVLPLAGCVVTAAEGRRLKAA